MRTEFLSVADTTMDVEVSHLFAEEDLLAVPVLDSQRRMLGIVTIDDVIDVDQDRVTAAMQKQGGMEVLDAPYLKTGLLAMVRKRAGWLAALFIGEMLTASAMAIYQAEIAKAVVLALFVPLIISSGGNSGSQSSTLIIRALALQEVRLRDWFQVLWRELPTGLLLGTVLAVIGLARILLWQGLFHTYGPNYLLIAATVSVSLVGVVSWGTFMGAMLPLLLRRLGFDPASASAPFVATLVDVSGLVIYFTVAETFLRGAAF
jgi:magnesium transporter